MSVVVRGIKMPESCEHCAYFTEGVYADVCQAKGGGLEYIIEEYVSYGKHKGERPDWCPLVELPSKHGRLVDCDKLVEKEEKEYLEQDKELPTRGIERLVLGLVHVAVMDTISEDNAPTVLEAEGEEDDA